MECLKTTHGMPLDVITEILAFLPVKSAIRFKCVCKEWCNLIDSPLFPKLHLNKSLKPDSQYNRTLFFTRTLCIVDDLYHPVKVTKLNWPKNIITDNDYEVSIGSCNGLVCFKVPTMDIISDDYKEQSVKCFLICNPTTRTFKLILPPSEKIFKSYWLSYGFGYDSDHDDYKIVVSNRFWTETDRDVHVYSLKADLWSCRTPPTPVSFGRCWVNQYEVIFINKMLHYLASSAKLVSAGEYSTDRDYRIVRFDVTSENWKDDLRLPIQVQVKNGVHLGELDGWLYLHVYNYLHRDNHRNDLWIMEEYGSWKLMFNSPQHIQCHYLIFARSKEGQNRLLLDNYTLFWYDQRDNTKENFKLEALPRDRSGIVCIASLVAIPGCSSTKLQEIKNCTP